MPPPRPNKAALTKFEADFENAFGKNTLRRTARIEKYEVVSTGSIALDYALGVGGYIEGRMTEIWGPDGTGKGHPMDHPILTPEGWRRIGDLIEGDFVISRDGRPTEVTGIYDRGELDVYEVKFNDGASVTVDDDHLWTVRASKGWVTYDTRTLRTQKHLQTPEGWNRYQIPLVDHVQHPVFDLPIEPYMLGVLLANGHLDGTPVIRTNDEFVRSQVFTIASHYGETVKEATSENSTAQGIAVHGMRDRLRFLGLYGTRSGTKFIPEQYLRADSPARAELLSGLMDCDGSSGARTNYHTTSRRLAEGVIELVRSLGGIARLYELDREHSDGRPYTEFTVRILIRACPFRTPAKSLIWKTPTKLSRRMVSIEPAGQAQVRCIKVAAEDSLYVIKDHVVTHNTTLSLIAIAEAQRKYPDRMTCFIDVEGKLDRQWAQDLGVDLSRMYHVNPPSAEEVSDIVKAMLQSKLISFIVLDSIGAMVNEEEMEKDADQRSVGTTPQVVTRMVKFAARLAEEARCHLLLINQVRANLSQFGGDTTVGGGHARGHATTVRLKARRAAGQPMTIGSGDQAVQVAFKIALKVEKNQAASPGRTAIITIVNQPSTRFGMEIGIADRAGEAFDVGKKTGVLKRKGAVYTMPDGTEVKGEDRCRALLAERPDLVAEIRNQVILIITSNQTPEVPEGEHEEVKEDADPRDPDIAELLESHRVPADQIEQVESCDPAPDAQATDEDAVAS